MTEVPIKIRFSKSLNNLLPSRLIVVKPDNASDFQLYITDKLGNPFPLKDEGGVINSIINSDGNLIITGTEDKTINISPALLSIINSALQSGDNISELVNDSGYITNSSLPTNTSDLINDGEDGTSTYVETDELGTTAFSNDYNDLDNLPVIPTPITNHSGLSLDDGTNPHGTTKGDVGLSNVPNIDASTTSNISEGSNLYFTTARVLATVLSGLSLATGGAIVSTDSILVAFGKIQNQINNLVTLNTTQTITGNKQFDNVRLIKKTNTASYPTTSGGNYRIGGTGGYDSFDFYSIDGTDLDSFGTVQIYSNPEEGNEIKHISLDNQQGSILRVNYGEASLRHIYGGQNTSIYIDGITDKIKIEGTQNKFAALGTSLITGTKNFEFPDKNGTLALSSDIIESVENKLDKVTSSGVERAYIINADGSQGTKATSEFGGREIYIQNISVSGGYTVDFNVDTHRLTLTGNTTFSEINLPPVGFSKTITLHINGNFGVVFPASWTQYISGAYKGTATLNTIVIETIGTERKVQISQPD